MAGGKIRAVLLTDRGPVVVETLEELARALRESGGSAYILLVEGEILGAVEARMASARPVEAGGKGASRPAGRGVVAAVFDQMFRGFADIVAREVPDVELHEIVGRGLERPVRVGRIYKQPARDDYDVLSLVERLAAEGKRVVFFTGDKRLANQAAALGDDRIIVEYMPPNEYPGKESLAKAMVGSVRRVLEEAGRGGRQPS